MSSILKHTNLLAIAGIHAVSAILCDHFDFVIKLWMADNCKNLRVLELTDKAKNQSIAIETVRARTLDDLSTAHQGIMAWCRPPSYRNFSWLQSQAESMHYLLVLDGITDCHNFGSCLRTAEAVGIDAVLVPHRHTSAINTGVAKAASGALYRLPLVQLQISKALKELGTLDYTIVGLSEHAGESIYRVPVREKMVVALGCEERGLSETVKSNCSHLASIPCSGINSSLNVSVVAGIAMFSLNPGLRFIS